MISREGSYKKIFMPTPKTLKIFLVDGEPTGTKIVEIGNWTGKAFVIPRNKLKNMLNREELNSQAVYFLIGETEDGKQMVYIGEAEEFKKRILQHNQNKDFWNLVICFISKDDNLTKTHIKYLENAIINEIKKANRVKIENGNSGSFLKLPESDEADMVAFLENLRIMISSLGFVFLENISVKNEDEEEVYFVKGRGVEGTVKLTNEGYVVQSGAIIKGKDAPSISTGLSLLRYSFMDDDDGAEKLENGNYRILENVIFSSPSYASSFILGSNSNGWIVLKNSQGKTLDELKRK